MLPEHDQPSCGNSLKVVPGSEDIVVLGKLSNPDVALLLSGQVREMLGKGSLLEKGLGLDLLVLDLDEGVLDRKTAEIRKSLDGLLIAALLHKPSRREGEPPNTQGEENGGDSLNDRWKHPREVALAIAVTTDVVATVSDLERKHDTENGAELIEGDEETSEFGGGELGVV